MPLQIVRNDITRMSVDAIVNAANPYLRGGSGVNGAIHKAAGPELLRECAALGGCETGQAKLTAAYALPCRHVIHTVGPVWQGGHLGERTLLASCYRSSLDLAKKHGCGSIAFPLISSGVYGYPKEQALQVATETIGEWLLHDDSETELLVYLVLFSGDITRISRKLFPDMEEFIDDRYADAHAQRRRARQQSMQLMGSALEDFASMPCPAVTGSLEDWLKKRDAGFAETLVALIEKSGKKNSEVYKKANVDKKLFSKIINNINYHPSKGTALAFAVALELNLEETKDLIARAGYSLTHSSKADIIVEYFILHRHYNVLEINMALFDHDQLLLGG